MRPWPPHQVDVLRRGWAEGATTGAIGRRLGKSRVAVYKKALALGLPMRSRGKPQNTEKNTEKTGPAFRVGGPKFSSFGPPAKRAIDASLAAGPRGAARSECARVGTSPAVRRIEEVSA